MKRALPSDQGSKGQAETKRHQPTNPTHVGTTSIRMTRRHGRTQFHLFDIATPGLSQSLGVVIDLEGHLCKKEYKAVRAVHSRRSECLYELTELLDPWKKAGKAGAQLRPTLIFNYPPLPKHDVLRVRNPLNGSCEKYMHPAADLYDTLLGDSDRPDAFMGTAMNAREAMHRQLLAYCAARRHGGPVPRYLEPFLIGSWIHDWLNRYTPIPPEISDRIRQFYAAGRNTARERAHVLGTTLAFYGLGSYVDAVELSRPSYPPYVVSSASPAIPLSASQHYWRTEIVAEPRPFGVVGQSLPLRPYDHFPHWFFRLALRATRYPQHFGITGADALPLHHFQRTHETLAIAYILLSSRCYGPRASQAERVAFHTMLVRSAWMMLALYQIDSFMCREYRAVPRTGRSGDPLSVWLRRCVSALKLGVEITSYAGRVGSYEEIRDLLTSATRALYSSPKELPFVPPEGMRLSGELFDPVVVFETDELRRVVLSAYDESSYCASSSPIALMVGPTPEDVVYPAHCTLADVIMAMPLDHRWKAVNCGRCWGCQHRVLASSVSTDCSAPVYLPLVAKVPAAQILYSDARHQLSEYYYHRRSRLMFNGERPRAIIHPELRYVHNFTQYGVVDSSERSAVNQFVSLYRMRAYSGIITVPHNHFIEGGTGGTANPFECQLSWMVRSMADGRRYPLPMMYKHRDPFGFDGTKATVDHVDEDDLGTAIGSMGGRRRFFEDIRTTPAASARQYLDRLIAQRKRLHVELLRATEFIRSCFETPLNHLYAVGLTSEADAACRARYSDHPESFPSDLVISYLSRHAPHTRRLDYLYYECAAKASPSSPYFGSLANDYGLPVKRDGIYYQLHIRMQNLLGTPRFIISTFDHGDAKLVSWRPSYNQMEVEDCSTHCFPGRAADWNAEDAARFYVHVRPFAEPFSEGQVGWLMPQNELGLSERAYHAIFEPEKCDGDTPTARRLAHQRLHSWEPLVWEKPVEAFGTYIYDPLTASGKKRSLKKVLRMKLLAKQQWKKMDLE